MRSGDSEEANRTAKQTVAELEEKIRYLERKLARYESQDDKAPTACRMLSPEATSLVVTVWRNDVKFGEVVIANGDWSSSTGVPGIIESDIILAYCRDNVAAGTAVLNGDTYTWKEAQPSRKP